MRQPEPQLTLALTAVGAAPFHQPKVHIRAPQPPTLNFTSRCSQTTSSACLELPAMFRNRYAPLFVVDVVGSGQRAVMFARRVRGSGKLVANQRSDPHKQSRTKSFWRPSKRAFLTSRSDRTRLQARPATRSLMRSTQRILTGRPPLSQPCAGTARARNAPTVVARHVFCLAPTQCHVFQ